VIFLHSGVFLPFFCLSLYLSFMSNHVRSTG
jgi:hypothetical protein